MLFYYFAIAGVALLFFVVIPAIGALLARRRWRRFRRRIVGLASLPTISYGTIERSERGFMGDFRCIGVLEAIQGGDTIWMTDGTTSVSADLSGVSVYLLPTQGAESRSHYESNDDTLSEETPNLLPWSKVSTLPQGTKLLIAGALYHERGHAIFRSVRQRPLTVLLFDGEESGILRRSVWSGRQHNEYWNPLTLFALLVGSTVLFVLAYNLSRVSMMRLTSIFTVVAGTAPALPFLPPGIALFFLYRTLWRNGRRRRAERDLLRLSGRTLGLLQSEAEVLELPDGERYGLVVVDTIEEALRIAPDARIRASPLEVEKNRSGFYAFGATRPNDSALGRPSDPLAEHVIVAGDPRLLARSASTNARFYELAAIASFVLGFAVNWVLLFSILGTSLR